MDRNKNNLELTEQEQIVCQELAKGKSQQEVAEITGTSQPTISRWVNERPIIYNTIHRIMVENYRQAVKIATKHAPHAIAEALKIMTGKKTAEKTKLSAAKLILKRAETVVPKNGSRASSQPKKELDSREEAIEYWRAIAYDPNIDLDTRTKARRNMDELLGFVKRHDDGETDEDRAAAMREFIKQAQEQEPEPFEQEPEEKPTD